jgi:hypothetical protein
MTRRTRVGRRHAQPTWGHKLSAGVLLFTAMHTIVSASDVMPPVLTVCEVLSDLQRYQGKLVVVVGRSGATSEGSWLDQECGFKVVRNGREFPGSISTA